MHNIFFFMVIEQHKVVTVHYTLTEDSAEGQLIESTEGRDPLSFIYGIGSMIPDFEKNLEGLKAGDTFAFGIAAEDAYGSYDDRMLVEIARSNFEQDGKVPEGLLDVGNVLPFTDQEGNQMEGMVAYAGLETVKIDFNHPMAGVNLFFTGSVSHIRDADAHELSHGHIHGPGGVEH